MQVRYGADESVTNIGSVKIGQVFKFMTDNDVFMRCHSESKAEIVFVNVETGKISMTLAQDHNVIILDAELVIN